MLNGSQATLLFVKKCLLTLKKYQQVNKNLIYVIFNAALFPLRSVNCIIFCCSVATSLHDWGNDEWRHIYFRLQHSIYILILLRKYVLNIEEFKYLKRKFFEFDNMALELHILSIEVLFTCKDVIQCNSNTHVQARSGHIFDSYLLWLDTGTCIYHVNKKIKQCLQLPIFGLFILRRLHFLLT